MPWTNLDSLKNPPCMKEILEMEEKVDKIVDYCLSVDDLDSFKTTEELNDEKIAKELQEIYTEQYFDRFNETQTKNFNKIILAVKPPLTKKNENKISKNFDETLAKSSSFYSKKFVAEESLGVINKIEYFSNELDSSNCNNRKTNLFFEKNLNEFQLETVSSEKCWSEQINVKNKGLNSFKKIEYSLNHRFNKNKFKDELEENTEELDSETRKTLLKIIEDGLVDGLAYQIGSGKTSNLFYFEPNKVLKIYKKFSSELNQRQKSIGDCCFSKSKKKSPKSISFWAQKEYSDLIELKTKGVSCPSPYFVTKNIIGMSFIGAIDKTPASTLKNFFSTDASVWESIFFQFLWNIRLMFHSCECIPFNLSEYNILYSEAKVYFIDVSPMISVRNPKSLNFLYSHCQKILKFFRKSRVFNTVSTIFLFKLIVDPFQSKSFDEMESFVRNKISEQNIDSFSFDTNIDPIPSEPSFKCLLQIIKELKNNDLFYWLDALSEEKK